MLSTVGFFILALPVTRISLVALMPCHKVVNFSVESIGFSILVIDLIPLEGVVVPHMVKKYWRSENYVL